MGGQALRSAALADQGIIDLLNERFVPVWIDVRTEPVPPLPKLDRVLIEARLDATRHVSNLFSLGFFLRSVVLNPEGTTILNWQPTTLMGSGMHLWTDGAFAYAQFRPSDYGRMLREALERFEFLEENRVVAR
ncbi:MAG: hypothetical protein ACYDCL_22295 [Myxococcales bacterium]